MDKKGIVSKTARGIGMGLLVAALAACSTGGPKVSPGVTLQQALNDYFAGNVTLAKAEFETVVKNDPNDQYGWYNLGVIAQGANDPGTAAKDYLKAISIQGDFESALYNLGVVRFQAGNIPDAITYLGRASVADPKDANALWNYGLALARGGTKADNGKAKTALNQALAINPGLLKSLGTPKRTSAPPSGGTAPGGSGAGGVTPKGQTPTTKPTAP